jgi:hypothetical protein
MSKSDFEFIHCAMVKVLDKYPKPSSHFDAKDIVNVGSVKSLINYLNQYNPDQHEEWRESIRYFFLPQDQTVLIYQFEKLKD